MRVPARGGEADAVSLVHGMEVLRRAVLLLEPVIGGSRHLRLVGPSVAEVAKVAAVRAGWAWPTSLARARSRPGGQVFPANLCHGIRLSCLCRRPKVLGGRDVGPWRAPR
jgi:hypothetical protein